MDQFMRWLAPRGAFGFVVRLIFFVGMIAAANVNFAIFFDELGNHTSGYYLSHAVVVGGPFVVIFLTIIVFQVRLQRQLWRLSREDGLTAINNRRSFFALTQQVRAKNDTGVLLMLDADRFKIVNDTHGHQAGDSCLKAIAYTLKRSIRQTDIVGRLGGEEFAIYLPKATASQALVIGERLIKPITFRTDEKQSLSITLSIGAVVSQPGTTIDQLFARADRALYRAKKNGRAQIVFDQVMAQMQNEMQQNTQATLASTSQ